MDSRSVLRVHLPPAATRTVIALRGLTVFIWFLFISMLNESPAQTDSVWVETAGRCYSTEVTPDEGWRRARMDAETNAIRDALGLRIAAETFQVNAESMEGRMPVDYFSAFSELNMSTTCGRVVAEEIHDSTLGAENNIPVYIIRIRALVCKEKGEPDPGFKVDVRMDKEIYYDRGATGRNDLVKFTAWANQDCYMYIFDIMANDSVMQLIPNAYAPDNFFAAAEGRDGFGKKIIGLPFNIRVALPSGKETTTEMLLLVALKQKIDFTSLRLGAGLTESSCRSVLLELQKWLVTIPQDLRATATASFVIKKR
jgi:Domain of unknown function (DUF4384)